jgi:ATP-binding cassette subfamily B protein
VKAFASEEYEEKKYNRKAQELREEYYQSERLQGVNSAWLTLYFTVALGLILWYGGWEIIRGNLTAGGLTMFLLFMNQLTFPIRASAQIINSFARAISSGRRIFDVLDAQSPVRERPDAREMGRADGYVRFKDVSFSYDPQVPALKHVDIEASPGQITAILGAPGSGKSTIVSLLPRFYDVTEGQITIDGEDIRNLTLQSLRRNVGIVQQDVYLFSASIRDNIAYGSANASFEDVVQAAKIAQLHDHIISLPDGYDTWVGERGATLSGGQRQRLSIARTILIDPPILILDDSTSSVDVETERLIHRAMVAVMKGRTTFVIAHRLSTVRGADSILVLQDGEIVERGSHEELIASPGIYRDIYQLQLLPQEEIILDAAVARDSGGDS